MKRPIKFLLAAALALCLTSCVSKQDYRALEQTLSDTETALTNEKNNVRATRDVVTDLQKKNVECEASLRDQVQKNRLLAQERDDLENANVNLNYKLEELKEELGKKSTVIETQTKTIDTLNATRTKIEDELKGEIQSKEVLISEMEGKLKVTFVDKILFDSGSAEINRKGQELLLRISKTLTENPDQEILVEGHTDDVPISPKLQVRFPTNWELSTARATSVVRFLAEQGKVAPERLSAAGYSFYKPVADNGTLEGRAQNRRIELILVPGKKKEEVSQK
ncbi:MAG: OmpA family protein [Thermodesulfobacteriota bacterium]